VDWRALANTALGDHVVSSPGPALLRKNYFETQEVSTLRYSASVPPAVSGVAWLILRDLGVLPLQPSVLRGEVLYFVDRMFTVRGEPRFSGEACARPKAAGIRAAVVLSGQPAASWSSEVVPNTTAEGNRYAVTIQGKLWVAEDAPVAPAANACLRFLVGGLLAAPTWLRYLWSVSTAQRSQRR